MRQLEQLGFPAIRDALQALVAAAEALRQPIPVANVPEVRLVEAAAEVEAAAAATAEAASSQRAALAARYIVDEQPNAAEWPDAAAAAAAAPCGAAYWARHVQHELCVQHSAQELRRRLLLHDAARAEYVLRDVAASAAAADAAAAAGGPPAVTIAFGAPEMEQQLQRYQAEAGPGQPRLSELSKEQLREIVQTTLEEGALALAQVHRPSTGAYGLPVHAIACQCTAVLLQCRLLILCSSSWCVLCALCCFGIPCTTRLPLCRALALRPAQLTHAQVCCTPTLQTLAG